MYESSSWLAYSPMTTTCGGCQSDLYGENHEDREILEKPAARYHLYGKLHTRLNSVFHLSLKFSNVQFRISIFNPSVSLHLEIEAIARRCWLLFFCECYSSDKHCFEELLSFLPGGIFSFFSPILTKKKKRKCLKSGENKRREDIESYK